jgi:hypothetical protein
LGNGAAAAALRGVFIDLTPTLEKNGAEDAHAAAPNAPSTHPAAMPAAAIRQLTSTRPIAVHRLASANRPKFRTERIRCR